MTIIYSKIFLYIASLVMVAYFSGAETALTSLSTLSLGNLKEKYPALKQHITFWEERPNEILAALVVGTTLAIIGSGILAASLAIDLSDKFALPRNLMLGGLPIVAAVLTLVFGEIAPKVISRYHAEQVAAVVIRPLVRFNIFFRPVTSFLLKISDKVISIVNRSPSREMPFLKADELKVLLLSDETIPLSVSERRIMENIFDFGKTKISQAMIPRSKIQAVNLDQEQEKVIDQIIEKEYSRVPVYRGNLDNIVGIIYSKDLALAWRGGSLFVIDDLIRPAYFIPGSARTDQVLREFKTGHQHMGIVVDEFGSTTGIATIEDLVEEIVGEIWDEYDIQEKTIVTFPDGSYLVRAGEELDKVNSELKLNLPAGEFRTVSGWILDIFGRIPKAGDTIRWGDLEIEIADADKRRVERVKLKKLKI